jgi:D-cysteine desulfhydrase
MIKIPKRVEIANLPTKIEKLERLSRQLGGPEIYIKRDDQTGTEISGNKIRKNEFLVREAIDTGCNTLITCGGIQSNHARSTAALAAKLGLGSHLVLRSDTGAEDNDGNYFIDQLLGASITLVSAVEYSNCREEIMEEIKQKLAKEGKKGYIIPEGASNAIGTFGYYNGMLEIIKQQEQLGIHFDAIVVAVGSGGTYGGLFLGNEIMNNQAKIYGFNVCKDKNYFQIEIEKIIRECLRYMDYHLDFSKDEINIIDGYVGDGYALSRNQELEFIRDIARLEGFILDPVYTGKGMYGLVSEIKKGTFSEHQNILFIHTGGLYGVFPKKNSFVLNNRRVV